MGQCEQHLRYPGWGVQPVTVERALRWSLPAPPSASVFWGVGGGAWLESVTLVYH